MQHEKASDHISLISTHPPAPKNYLLAAIVQAHI
jgi:hypothetical protein